MVFDIVIVCNLFKDEAKYVFEGVFLIRRHITADTLIIFIEDPLKAGVDFTTLVHGEGNGSHFEIYGKLVGFFLVIFGIFELNEVVVLPLYEAYCAFGKSMVMR